MTWAEARERKALRRALRGLLTDLQEISENSYRRYEGDEWHWNDAIWKAANSRTFALAQAARKALAWP